MIIDLHKKYDVSPEWFEERVRDALNISNANVVEKLALPRLCELLAVYRTNDEIQAREAADRMRMLINSSLIDIAME